MGTILARYWKQIAVVLILAGSVWSIYHKGQEDAIEDIKVEQLTNIVEIKNEQQKAAASAPRTIDAVVDSLSNGTF